MHKPLELSRYCIPFTPMRRKLEESSICLVTTAAIRHKDDKPFALEGDTSFRLIRSDATTAELAYDDTHYDHACVDQDLNCVFPIDRLTALAREGRIGGLTEQHFSLGFTQALRELRETTLPGLVHEVDKVRPDAVLLTGG
jgi:D-proline reductase (dithiol) PrdB